MNKDPVSENSADQSSSLRKELSDEKFIAWSKSTLRDDFDVTELSDYIDSIDASSVQGLDIGGGIGAFASTVAERCNNKNLKITVVDPGVDASEQRIEHPGVDFVLAPFDSFNSDTKYDFIVFRLVLHHLIGEDSATTLRTQREALVKAKSMLSESGVVFVIENFYEPWIGQDFTGQLIYSLTSSKAVEGITRRLGANTAGEGVRFRSAESWKTLYDNLDLKIVSEQTNPRWGIDMPIWQKLPLLCKERYQAIQMLKV